MTNEKRFRVLVKNTKTGKTGYYYGIGESRIQTINGKQFIDDCGALAEILETQDVTREFAIDAKYFARFGTACE